MESPKSHEKIWMWFFHFFILIYYVYVKNMRKKNLINHTYLLSNDADAFISKVNIN